MAVEFHFFDAMKVLAKPIHLKDEVIHAEIKNELDRHVLENILLLRLTVFVHVQEELVFGCQHVVPLQVID
jgi:hypothetical protein